MNIALWIVAGLLAVAFLASGAMKLIQPKEKLAAVGLVLLMVRAVIMHVRRREAQGIVVTLALSPCASSWRGAASAPIPLPADPAPRHHQREPAKEGNRSWNP